jgi:hypothetical protein
MPAWPASAAHARIEAGTDQRHHACEAGRTLIGSAEHQESGINREILVAQLEMEVRSGAPARASGLCDQLSLLHDLARMHHRASQVRVHRRVAVPMANDDDLAVAVESLHEAGARDDAV